MSVGILTQHYIKPNYRQNCNPIYCIAGPLCCACSDGTMLSGDLNRAPWRRDQGVIPEWLLMLTLMALDTFRKASQKPPFTGPPGHLETETHCSETEFSNGMLSVCLRVCDRKLFFVDVKRSSWLAFALFTPSDQSGKRT